MAKKNPMGEEQPKPKAPKKNLPRFVKINPQPNKRTLKFGDEEQIVPPNQETVITYSPEGTEPKWS